MILFLKFQRLIFLKYLLNNSSIIKVTAFSVTTYPESIHLRKDRKNSQICKSGDPLAEYFAYRVTSYNQLH